MPIECSNLEISFRPIRDNDLSFLNALYASTREEEMKMVPWTKQQKSDFLTSQFDAQHKFYQEQFPNAELNLILFQERIIGRLYLDYREEEIRIVDIAIIPTARRSGIGTQLLKDVISTAAMSKKAVRIHVEKNNPALSLYQRLDFNAVEDQGVYQLMEWRPSIN